MPENNCAASFGAESAPLKEQKLEENGAGGKVLGTIHPVTVQLSRDLIRFAAMYTLGERLLAEEFMQEVRKKVYTLLRRYQRATRLRWRERDQPILNGWSWLQFSTAAKIIFEGTLQKRFKESFLGLAARVFQNPKSDLEPCELKKTKSRECFLDGNPVRNLFAAFLADEWTQERSNYTELKQRWSFSIVFRN
ncbi:hypothetical protein BJ508DRAFT_82556 [Ascobolus immersus RN42]|uniref:Uncharacterized protein n=1 Tax=Ascobolus immersus RN42 TaxID=1160509 RepID=A0A3N4HC46_ASCIM|nr:hypothetical protein BJ508DRAFT_82556 [Ascobolus immersus RN42]